MIRYQSLLCLLMAICSPLAGGLCGFGVVDYKERLLRFPKTDIAVPDGAEVGTSWRATPQANVFFDCTVYSVGFPTPGSLEVSCCQFNSSDTIPWAVDQRTRLLKGLLQIYMEASLG